MKKYLILILFPVFCISQDFNAGIIGGFSTSQVSGDELSGFNKIGPRIGCFVNKKINWYYLQLELQYIIDCATDITLYKSHKTSYLYSFLSTFI